MKLHLDFETFSAAPLERCGAYVYAADRSTVVTVIAWAFDNGPVQSVVWPATRWLPQAVLTHIAGGGTVSAHNASFEHALLTKHFCQPCDFTQLDCTMERAYVAGLPGKLGAAGMALKLSVVKDEKEKPLMTAMSKPPKKGPPIHEIDPVKLARLEAYCRQDVEAERALDDVLPPLSEFERKVSQLTYRSNDIGVLIDSAAVWVLQRIVDKEMAALGGEMKALTGLTITQCSKLLAWLAPRGVAMPGLKKEYVAEFLEKEIGSPAVRRVLEIRALAGKSSLAKLEKMATCVSPDGRARGQIQYYGAGRTGRWAGRLIQPQNLPNPPKGLNAIQALETIMRMGEVPSIVYDRPLDVVSACLRPCIMARPGHTLLSLDLSQIEARVLAWLAGQNDVVDAFAKGDDVYVMAAAKLGSKDRQLGKVMTLACGYGMGLDGEKFQNTAKTQYGLEMSLRQAASAVAGYRETNQQIVAYWGNLASAFMDALKAPGLTAIVGKVSMVCRNSILRLTKPNGGVLYYHQPRFDRKEGLTVMGPADKGGSWVPQKTYGGKLAENVTQAVARDVMAEAIVRVRERLGWTPIMTVHDEAVYEIPADAGTADMAAAIKKCFEEVPSWAAGLPIASDTKSGRRFSK